MTPAQALALAILSLEWEAESAPDRGTWRRECNAAAAILREMRENLVANNGLYETE
jgi:hypothetical protein